MIYNVEINQQATKLSIMIADGFAWIFKRFWVPFKESFFGSIALMQIWSTKKSLQVIRSQPNLTMRLFMMPVVLFKTLLQPVIMYQWQHLHKPASSQCLKGLLLEPWKKKSLFLFQILWSSLCWEFPNNMNLSKSSFCWRKDSIWHFESFKKPIWILGA